MLVTGKSGDPLTDYQVLVNLTGEDFPEEAKPDGADIRFAELGNSLLTTGDKKSALFK